MRIVGQYVLHGLHWLDRAVSYSWHLAWLAAALITYEVVMRYFFNSPHLWFVQVATAICVLFCFLGAGRATSEGRHVSLGIVYARLNPSLRRKADMVIGILTIIANVLAGFCVLQYGLQLDRIGAVYYSGVGAYSDLAYIILVGLSLCALFGLQILLRAIFVPGIRN